MKLVRIEIKQGHKSVSYKIDSFWTRSLNRHQDFMPKYKMVQPILYQPFKVGLTTYC